MITLFVLMALLCIRLTSLTASAQGVAQAETEWRLSEWSYRLSISAAVGDYARTDKPVELPLNFTSLLLNTEQSSAVDLQSLRLVEVIDGTEQETLLPVQFDIDADYDAASHASGTLIFLLDGTTPANTARSYHLYFDLADKALPALTYTDQTTITHIVDEGQSALHIQTAAATYFYQEEAGGISSLLDRDGNDWISYQAEPAESAGGAYRGIPNMVYPEGGFHPGATGHETTVIQSGPLKETLRTTLDSDHLDSDDTGDGDEHGWEVLWEFFPNYARMTVIAIEHPYWFLYEGTPGGALEVAQDLVVLSDGTAQTANTRWNGDLDGEEWLYFADPAAARSLYLVHHAEDTIMDSYRAMSDEGGSMTVMGFGRRSVNAFFESPGEIFTVGLMEEIEYDAAAAIVRGAYKPLTATVGSIELRPMAPTPQPTATPTLQPTPRPTAQPTPLPTQEPQDAAAMVTIIKDARPDARRNFRYTGVLGDFVLDDPTIDDDDAYGSIQQIPVASGQYLIKEMAARGWHLQAIDCNDGADATVDVAIDIEQGAVALTIEGDASVTCTFVSERQSLLRIKYTDGVDHDVALFGADDTLITTQTFNQWGKSSFAPLTAGTYMVCVDEGAYCTEVVIEPAQLTHLEIGLNRTATLYEATTPGEDERYVSTITHSPLTDDPDEVDESAPEVDPWLSVDDLSHQIFLPFVAGE